MSEPLLLPPGMEFEDSNMLDRLKDPHGRVDWLAYSLAKRAVTNSRNPILVTLFHEIKDPLARHLRRTLGPKRRSRRRVGQC